MKLGLLLFAEFSLLLPSSSWAQFEFQVGATPGAYENVKSTSPTSAVRLSTEPFAEMLAQKLLQTKTTSYWENLGLTTTSATYELSKYIKSGFGRLEIIAVLMIAEEGKQKLEDLAKKRIDGAKLKDLAERFKLNYTTIRANALQLKNKIVGELQLKLDTLKVEESTQTKKSD